MPLRTPGPFDVAPGEPVAPSEVLTRELVLPSRQHGPRRFIDRVARSHGFNPTVEIEMEPMPQI
jgi:hypothetical protein